MTLKEVRKLKHITQEEAASILEVPLRTYKRYENDPKYFESYKYEAAVLKLKNYKGKTKKTRIKINKDNLLIVGAGFVGSACGEVYSKRFDITFVDIDENKLQSLKGKYKVSNSIEKIKEISNVLLCLPTDYDEETKTYKTDAIESSIESVLKVNPNALIIVKSTVAVGYTNYLSEKFNHPIYFMPEFLREKYAVEDAKRPIRLLVGADKITGNLRKFSENIEKSLDIPMRTSFVSNKEAEAIKLFSNSYLAMRVSFFNELDQFAMEEGMNSKAIISSLGLDDRIGDSYNNPSYCYSGYCLPKDVKVLGGQTVGTLLKAIDKSNADRKRSIVNSIIFKAYELSKDPVIGVYKTDFSKERHIDSLSEIHELLKKHRIKTLLYTGKDESLEEFANKSTLIICEKMSKELLEYKNKVYTRNIK